MVKYHLGILLKYYQNLTIQIPNVKFGKLTMLSNCMLIHKVDPYGEIKRGFFSWF